MEPLQFTNETKVRKQMRKRGWTEAQLREALATPPMPWQGKLGPAFRYQYPVTGKVVLADARTHEIFHVGGERFRYD